MPGACSTSFRTRASWLWRAHQRVHVLDRPHLRILHRRRLGHGGERLAGGIRDEVQMEVAGLLVGHVWKRHQLRDAAKRRSRRWSGWRGGPSTDSRTGTPAGTRAGRMVTTPAPCIGREGVRCLASTGCAPRRPRQLARERLDAGRGSSACGSGEGSAPSARRCRLRA